MTIKQVREKAKQLGIKAAANMKKTELIQAIQIGEGNFPCYSTAISYCDQMACCWRADCLPVQPSAGKSCDCHCAAPCH